MEEMSVSVIIPTYNRANKIEASIKSVLDQSYKNLEVIVVDDGSTDNTAERVSAISDDRVIYHRLDQNNGVSNARNIGVGLCNYDIIAFNDSDDIWHPDKLERQMEFWMAHPEHKLVYCPYTVNIPSGGSIQVPSKNEDIDTLSGDIFYYLLLRPTIGTPTMILKKELFLELGGFDITCEALVDWELSVRISHTGSIGYVDSPLVTVEATAKDRISNDDSFEAKMKHYDTKCKVFARYVKEIDYIGMFDTYAKEILDQAEKDGLVKEVKNLMENYLQRSYL